MPTPVNKPRRKALARQPRMYSSAAVNGSGVHPQELRRQRMALLDKERLLRCEFEREPTEAWAFLLRKVRDQISDLEDALIMPALEGADDYLEVC